MLIALALASVGAWSNMLFILIIALNTLIGIVQELHAKRLVDRLSLLSMPSARVIRDGAAAEIPVEKVVLEDVIELEAGRQVCADAVILTGQVEVDESLLTGESDPVHRAAGDKLLSDLTPETADKVRRCAMVLKMADVLDRHRRGQVKAAVLERMGINADLTIVADGDVSMEAWRLEELRPDFEDLFGVRLRIHTDPVPERKVL